MKVSTTMVHLEEVVFDPKGSTSIGQRIDSMVTEMLLDPSSKVKEISVAFSDAELEAMKMFKEHQPGATSQASSSKLKPHRDY